MTNVLLIGEAMGLFGATEEGSLEDASLFKKSIAGAELNVAIGLSRLDHKVQYMTKLGNDPIGKSIEKLLKKEKIGTDYLSHSTTEHTGLMLKNKVTDGDPETAYFRKNSAFTTLTVDDVKEVDFTDVTLLHITGIPVAVSESVREAVYYLIEKAKENDTFITFDPNLRPSLWQSTEEMTSVLNHIATFANVVMPGISEGRILMGSEDSEEIAQYYLNNGAQAVITKSGADGAFVTEKGKKTVNVKGFKVDKVVDTVGAGDGFAVGVIHALLNGLPMEEAALYGNAIGSLQVQYAGDNEGLPTKDALEAYIKQYN